jgi:hypothetical protein
VTIDRDSAVYASIKKWAATVILPEIVGSRDLDGFTVDDFRQFYVALWINCHCITRLEDVTDRALGHEHLLGSRLLQGNRDYIAYWVSRYCALPSAAARNIVERLTFDPTHRHPSLAGHPFVPSVDGAVTMLPRLFARTDPNLMLSMALNAGASRRLYESIIEEIETAAKQRLASLLREHGYAVWDDPSLERPGMVPLTPDLVVGRNGDDWIAVTEYKHALPPRGAAAVSDRIKEASKWINKAKRYLFTAASQSQSLQTHLGIAIKERRVIVVIVPRWPMPVPVAIDSEDICIRDVSRVERAVGRNASIAEVFGIGSAASRPSVRLEYHDIRVGDWTYKHPILIPETESGPWSGACR